MDEQLLDDVLRGLLARDNREPLQLDEDQLGGAQIGMPELSGPEVDQLIRDAKQKGWAEGNVKDTAPGGHQFAAYWFRLRVTADGVRHLGEWPAEGKEHLPGNWDDGIWGQVDRPLLASLAGQA